ncbi:MAG: BFD-like (2Fe-2S) protein [Desulfobacteraceae bacterium]|nr:MAG: BFD-like (2Fe-2S) protein [Desulfobacteraceae bacterium]
MVCYCFEYTRKDIEKDYRDNRRSLILEKIANEKKTGGCNCAVKNPKGL